jgi:hypothetical protein
MMSRENDVAWLQRCMREYCANKRETGELIKDFDEVGKLGQGFSSVDELEEVNLRKGVMHRPTYINMYLIVEQKDHVVGLLKEFTDYFTWEYIEMSGLSHEVVEHTLPIKRGFKPYKQPP